MRRPPHGGTARPGPTRPGSGYGRAAGRPGPEALGAHVNDRVATAMVPMVPMVPPVPPVLEPWLFSEPVAGVEAPAPVTP
ncbi:MAG: hypothetical protein QOF40_3050 [Actinomycetota bacterium]|jgi:hypothetical protein|nr:hypothetical protein [Actinomycetota bacterium]